MNVSKLITYIPDSVKIDISDVTDVKLKNGSKSMRVTIDRILTDDEMIKMRENKHFIGVGCIASYRYAPEIQKSYFYVK